MAIPAAVTKLKAKKAPKKPAKKEETKEKLSPGDSIDFDLNGNGQTEMF